MDIPKESKRGWKAFRNGLILTTVTALLIAATVGFSRLKEADPQIDEDLLWIGTVQRGEFVRQVRGNGILVPKIVWWLSSPVDGQVATVHVEPGERVEAGEAILTLTNHVLEQEVQDARWQLQAAKAELENRTAQLESQELDSEDAIVTLEAQLHVAQLEATRDNALYREGILGKHQSDTSEAKELELKTRLGLAKRRLEIIETSTKAALAVQQATVEQLTGLLSLKVKQRADLVVTSQGSGIMKQLLVEVGQQVTSSTTLAYMAEPEILRAELNIPETQIRDVATGQPVLIDTRNGMIDGVVARIDPAVLNGTVKVDVTLTSELPKSARPDLSVEGRIELERRPDVLHVERPVSSREDMPMEIFRIAREEGVAERRLVRLGRSSVTTIEILDGLEPGDEIILSDMSKYEGDDRIRLR